VGGNDLAVKDVELIMAAISARAPVDCHIAMGTVVDEASRGRVAVAVLASEEWRPETPATDTGASRADGRKPEAAAGRGRKNRRSRPTQTKLRLETYGKGRFKGVEPTVLDGEDLDIPTFVRRGVAIDK
jgi:cell division protein FtsZ